MKQIASTSQPDVIHNVTIDLKNNYVSCDCSGFICHGRCKHIRFYRETISKLLYSQDLTPKIINSFKKCKEIVREAVDENPELHDYKKLVKALDWTGYSPETITRCYRKLKEQDEIDEPEHTSIKREHAEHVMHDINRWDSGFRPIGIRNGQTALIEEN